MQGALRTGLAAALTVFAAASSARAEIIGADSFAYPDGAIAGHSGGTGWAYGHSSPSAWAAAQGSPQVTSATLNTNGDAAARHFGTNGSSSAIQGTGALYFRVDLQFGTEDASQATTFAGISSTYDGTEMIQFGRTDGQSTYGIALPGLVFADTYLPTADCPKTTLAGSIQWDSTGGMGVAKLWISPDSSDFDTILGQNPGTDTTADAILFLGLNSDWSDGVQLRSDTPVTWNKLAVATTFAEATSVPEPSMLGLLTLAGLAAMRRR